MLLSELKALYASHPRVADLLSLLSGGAKRVRLTGLNGSAASLCCSVVAGQTEGVVVVALSDLEDAGYFYHDLTQLSGDERVLFFPSSFKRAVKYGRRDPANAILRNEVLGRLGKHEVGGLCIVTYADALVERVVAPRELDRNTLMLHRGEHVDMGFITEVLTGYGFERVEYVYEPGQYAVRGSLIDVFSFASEYPFRIDFFGDEVDSLRTFRVDTQLSVEQREEVVIVPDLTVSGEQEVVSTEQSTPDSGVTFFEYLPADALLWTESLATLCQRATHVVEEATSANAEAARQTGEGDVQSFEGLLTDAETFTRAALALRRIETTYGPASDMPTVAFACTAQPVYHKNFDLLSQGFCRLLAEGNTLYVCSDSRKQTDRLASIFNDRGDDISFTAVERTLHAGFTDADLHACIFTDHQIFDRYHKYSLRSDRARSGKVALSLRDLNTFNPGDYVVHTDHGVGRFAGLLRIPTGNTTQEVMKIVYQNDDVVFVSIHSLHKVSKYKGKEGEAPRLNKLGTGAWEKMKERTKAKIKDIARDLILLYSRRLEEKGFAFSPDSFMQHELEASFLYEDTPDQSRATADVKHDMESQRPMDRLVCGDVGFGKTEVAIRAAFKAVADNKQVAVLVPTTVLAYQHFRTFSERLKDMPCRVDYLSRARQTKDVRAVLRDLKAGQVNILIGTHRILGKDVQFADLGLLIVDEEQKFGVSVKEKLRQMKVNVDTLTLTATPIPRTLQFSLMGARDLSVIQTPPPNRYPIQTEVHTFNEEIIADAIRFEISRNGQVFFVNNRIANLEQLRDLIVRAIPDCRVAIGHGQMDPTELEKTVLDFANYDYDVLLATTIVENGVDIPNANTIIINQAQNFGLSDLHQMRGRVGRSNKKAFCYLLAPPLSTLPQDARRRLQAIENFSGLGSGIQIAMQDLDIRGAGNLLGAEQSGFIADVGYETYQKILGEAVRELKTQEFARLYAAGNSTSGNYVDECTVESDLELLLPDSYVAGSSERMLLYRELDGLSTQQEVDAFRTRLQDRFGPLPRETRELLRVPELRRMAASVGVEKVLLKGGRMTLSLVQDANSPYYQSPAFDAIIAYAVANPKRCELKEAHGRRNMLVRMVESVDEAAQVLGEIAGKKG